jgi:predicted nucleic acid-binding protein
MARPLPTDEVRQIVQDYMNWEIVVNGPGTVVGAMEIEMRYKISFWDALVVHAAESSGAGILYSEDLASRQKYGSIDVVNPLVNA